MGSYEKVMARAESAKTASNTSPGSPAGEVNEALRQGGYNKDFNLNHFASPSRIVPARIYGEIDSRMDGWLRQNAALDRGQAAKNYQQQIIPGVKKLRQNIDQIVLKTQGNPTAAKEALLSLGMKQGDVYWTREYLNYLEHGGPFFNFGRGDGSNLITRAADNTVSAYISWRPAVILGHGLGFIPRAIAKAAPHNVILGTLDAFHATGGNITKQLPQLKSEGVYGNPFFHPEGVKAKIKEAFILPLHLSQTVADNVAYHIGAREGDPYKAVKDIALSDRPWDTPYVYQTGTGRAGFSLMRYHLNYTKMYAGMAKDIVTGAAERNPQKFAAGLGGMAAYTASQALLYGGDAAVPAFLYKALPDNQDEGWGGQPWLSKEFWDNLPSAGKAAKEATGVDLSKKAQPLGGFATGVGYNLSNEQVKGSWDSAMAAMDDATQGNTKHAIGDTIDAASIILIPLTGYPITAQKLSKVGTKLLREEITPEDVGQETKAALFGKEATQ